MQASMREWLATHQPEFAAIRRDIHAHPELGLEEVRTAGSPNSPGASCPSACAHGPQVRRREPRYKGPFRIGSATRHSA